MTNKQLCFLQEAEGIALKNVAGVFYILAMGAGLAFFTAIIELVWHRYLRRGTSVQLHIPANKNAPSGGSNSLPNKRPAPVLHVNNIQFIEPIAT